MEEIKIERKFEVGNVKITLTITNDRDVQGMGEYYSTEIVKQLQKDYLKAIDSICEFAKKVELKLK